MFFYRFDDSDEIREANLELGYEKIEETLSKFIFGNEEPSCSFVFKSMENNVYVFERVFGSRHTYEKKASVKKSRKRWVSPKRRWRSRSPVSNIK